MIIIAHADKNNGIGKHNDLMFRLPLDMKFFRETTTDSVVIMGRKTLESFPGKKPLPKRVNIVITRNPGFEAENVITAHSPADAARISKDYPDKKVFVIGGGNIYEEMLPYCDTALITRVYEDGNADTFIHDFDSDPLWYLAEESEEINDNGHTIKFCTYIRK